MRRRLNLSAALAGALGTAILLAGCTAGATKAAGSGNSPASSSSSTASGGPSGTLTIANESGALWTCGFNPFNPSDTGMSFGFEYEPLVYINPLQNGKTTPMLATSWNWSNNNTTLTFTIRSGVKWSDGTPLTAADVAYTFNLMKQHSALDTTGIWSVLNSVNATGPNTVTMTFKQAAVPYFFYIADQTPIVPKHIFSKLANPVTATVPKPVGSGPYLMTKCTPQNVTYTANPHYWQQGEPKVETVEYPAYTSNSTANNDLATGKAQWGAQYIPSIKTFYTAKSPDYHYWFPATTNVSLIPNLTNPLLSNVKVREALSYAIDRSKVSQIGETGYEPPANQTGIVTPTFSADLSSQASSAWGKGYDPAKAISLLKQAGFHKGSDGIMVNSSGQKLQFSCIDIGDYSDWVASMQVVTQDLAAIGVSVKADNMSNTAYTTDLTQGKFQLAYGAQPVFGPSPYYELNNWLSSAKTAPVGQQAASNYERYKSASTDALLKQYAAATSQSQQQQILGQLQQVMVTSVPFIPVVEAADWYQYDTAKFTGWPTASNPYAQPPAWAYPDEEQVLLHLTPVK